MVKASAASVRIFMKRAKLSFTKAPLKSCLRCGRLARDQKRRAAQHEDRDDADAEGGSRR